MGDELVQVGEGFWNIRGSFKIGGLFDVGTQMSLVRRARGDFVLLDSYPLSGSIESRILELTDGGKAIAAIVNLHPFHTLHVRNLAERFPRASLYGTRRHMQKEPALPWQEVPIEDPQAGALFEGDLTLSVPRGVDFIPANENLHFASVLAFHPASNTLHVDDTLTWMSLPLMKGLRFHPTLAKVLERRPGAVTDFRSWTRELTELCSDVTHLCTAHMHALPPQPTPLAALLPEALTRIEKALNDHERRFG